MPTQQIAGRRVTDVATLDVMKMVLAGKLNVDLCATLVASGVKPVGLHGASGLGGEGGAPKPSRTRTQDLIPSTSASWAM